VFFFVESVRSFVKYRTQILRKGEMGTALLSYKKLRSSTSLSHSPTEIKLILENAEKFAAAAVLFFRERVATLKNLEFCYHREREKKVRCGSITNGRNFNAVGKYRMHHNARSNAVNLTWREKVRVIFTLEKDEVSPSVGAT